MSEPAREENTARVDVDLVLSQFDVLGRDAHRAALVEAVRARDVYRKLTEELQEKIAKIEQSLIGSKSERFTSRARRRFDDHLSYNRRMCTNERGCGGSLHALRLAWRNLGGPATPRETTRLPERLQTFWHVLAAARLQCRCSTARG